MKKSFLTLIITLTTALALHTSTATAQTAGNTLVIKNINGSIARSGKISSASVMLNANNTYAKIVAGNDAGQRTECHLNFASTRTNVVQVQYPIDPLALITLINTHNGLRITCIAPTLNEINTALVTSVPLGLPVDGPSGTFMIEVRPTN